jgi:hypothetical protein
VVALPPDRHRVAVTQIATAFQRRSLDPDAVRPTGAAPAS